MLRTSFILALPAQVHRIITALREAVLALPIVCDDGTVDGAAVVVGDAADNDAVRARGGPLVDVSASHNGKFEVGSLVAGWVSGRAS